jgi:hypothetical protein
MGLRGSGYTREQHGWYVEDAPTVTALLNNVDIARLIHDPCCGSGVIVEVAIGRGLRASGADIVDRASGRFAIRDFLVDQRRYPNIITNPPYGAIAVQIIEHAINHVSRGGLIAALVPLGFLASQGRYALFQRPEFDGVIIFESEAEPAARRGLAGAW